MTCLKAGLLCVALLPVLLVVLFAPAASAQTLPAATHIDSIEGGRLVKIITVYPWKIFPLDKQKGEDTVGTYNMLVNVDAKVRVEGSNIVIRVSVVVTEDGGAGTTYAKTEKKEALIVGLENPDYTIVGFEKDAGKVNATVPYEQTGWINHGGDGIIKSAECIANTRGMAVGKLGCNIEFNTLRLVMEKKK